MMMMMMMMDALSATQPNNSVEALTTRGKLSTTGLIFSCRRLD